MKKRGTAVKVISLTLIVLFSISLISASFLGDLFNTFFRGTGWITVEGSSCVDSDGPDNFNVAGQVTVSGQAAYNDFCDGNIAYDYKCVEITAENLTSTTKETGGTITAFLSLINPPITGRVVGDPTYSAGTTSHNCAIEQKTCISGVCGCTEGSNISCGPAEGNTGECNLGIKTCTSGEWGSCVGAIWPTAEICDGLDNDCDGTSDESTCTSPQTCQYIINRWTCAQSACNDGDTDGYGNPGSSSCIKGSTTDCNDNNASIYPSATEICGNGVDEDCSGSDLTCPVTCTDNDKDGYNATSGGNCGTTADCNDNNINIWRYTTVYPNSDFDNYYSSTGQTQCIGTNAPTGYSLVSGTDCNDNNDKAYPGAPEICDNTDNQCVGDTGYGQTDEGCDDDSDNYCELGLTIIGTPSTCTSGGNDCNDNNGNIKPGNSNNFCDCNSADGYDKGTIESCTDTKDNDCDGFADCDDEDCSKATNSDGNPICGELPCEDKDGDTFKVLKEQATGSCGEIDCDDTKADINPGEKEVCDGIDNDCNSETNEATLFTLCGEGAKGECTTKQLFCVNGKYENEGLCNSNVAGLILATNEICDGKDNDCDGSPDDGVANCCTDGQNQTCTPDEACKLGQQTCTNKAWGSCVITGDKPNCNVDTDCDPGKIEVCGTNVGICFIGSKKCSDSGTWESCLGAVNPKTEACNDKKDNDCDGTSDETDCVIIAENDLEDYNTQDTYTEDGTNIDNEEGTSDTVETVNVGARLISSSEQGTMQEEELGFFEKVWGFVKLFFNLGRSLIGFSISEEPVLSSPCTDSDGGKNIFQIASGEGLAQDGTRILFTDFCYEENLGNQVTQCGGDNCFLSEFYCSEDYVKYDAEVKCSYGCSNGACIPDSSLSEDCLYFDKNLWKWVNNC